MELCRYQLDFGGREKDGDEPTVKDETPEPSGEGGR